MIDYSSLSKTLDHFRVTGYPLEFQLQASALYCPDLDARMSPEEFDVVSAFHFGQSPGEEERTLYVISSLPGLMGTLVLTAGEVYSEEMSFEKIGRASCRERGWVSVGD